MDVDIGRIVLTQVHRYICTYMGSVLYILEKINFFSRIIMLFLVGVANTEMLKLLLVLK